MLYWLYETHAHCSLFNAVYSMFLIFYNLPTINNILLFYNTFFLNLKDLNGKLFFHVKMHYIIFSFNFVFLDHYRSIFFGVMSETNLLVIKPPKFDSYNMNKDIQIYIF